MSIFHKMNILICPILLSLIMSKNSLPNNKLLPIKNDKKFGKENKIFLYKIKNNECGHCEIERKFSKFAKTFTNLKEGNCIENGYINCTGYEKINVPILGKINIEKFIKNNKVSKS